MSFSVKISWWQSIKSSLSLNMVGLLSCSASHNVPSLLRLDAVTQSFQIFLKILRIMEQKKLSGRPKKNFTEDSNGCPSKHGTILDPNYCHCWRWLQPNNHQTASAREGLRKQKMSPTENIWGWKAREVYKNGHQFQAVDALREAIFTKTFPLAF